MGEVEDIVEDGNSRFEWSSDRVDITHDATVGIGWVNRPQTC